MESQPQNPEFRNNPENFHPCILKMQFHQNSFTHVLSYDKHNQTFVLLHD